MSGLLRLFLALLVVVSHLVASRYVAHFGFYAVRTFFVLSGFVMTSALNEVCAHDGVRFWINRLLRLVPPYLLVCLATGFAIKVWPGQAAAFMARWALPMTTEAVTQNLVIAPLAFGDLGFRFIEPAWSIAVEIMMYVVLFAGVARSAQGAMLGLALGAGLHTIWLATGAPFDVRYFSPAGALLSFSLGACVYFARRAVRLRLSPKTAVAIFAIWLANAGAEGVILPYGYAENGGFYINVALATLIVGALPEIRVGALLRRLDDACGRLSYPVFLLQWIGGFLVTLAVPSTPPRGWTLFALALPTILALAAGLAAAHERYVEPLRARVRNGEGFDAAALAVADAPAPARGNAATGTARAN